MHLDAPHVLINGLVLWYAGRALEAIVGRLWFAVVFIVGGVAGCAMSLVANPHNMVSVGASGAIMGVLAATYVLAFHYEEGATRKKLPERGDAAAAPSLIPLGVSFSASAVDYHAHLGGTVAGASSPACCLRSGRARRRSRRCRVLPP